MTTPTTLQLAAQRAAAGKAAAAARLAAMPLAEQLHVALVKAEFLERLVHRTFVGPGTEKGRQPLYCATHAEAAEWRARQVAV